MLRKLKGHKEAVCSVTFSRDGDNIVSGSSDGTIRIWCPWTGDLRREIRGHSAGVNAVAIATDGSLIASASDDSSIRIWRSVDGGQEAILSGHGFAVYSVAFSPDCRSVASGSFDKTVRIWQIPKPNEEVNAKCLSNEHRRDTAILKGHSDSVFCVAYNADGSLLTSCGRDKRIIVWSVCDGAARSSITLLYTYLRSAAFNPHGTLLAAGCGDSRVMLAALPPSDEDGTATPDVPTATTAAAEGAGDPVSAHTASKAAGSPACGASQPPAPSSSPEASARSPFTGHRGAVMSVAWSGDGQWIASGAGDGTAMLWGARTGRLAAAPAVHGSPVLCVAFSAVGSLLAAADDGGNVILWDLAGPERRLAVAMATHSRLGARSSLGGLEPELLARIAAALPVWAPP